MPTAADFRSAATNVQVAAGTVTMSANSIRHIEGNTGLVAGGSIQVAVSTGLSASSVNGEQLSSALLEGGAEFERRAGICATYTAEMRQWRADHAAWAQRNMQMHIDIANEVGFTHPGTAPSEPLRPAPWVDEG